MRKNFVARNLLPSYFRKPLDNMLTPENRQENYAIKAVMDGIDQQRRQKTTCIDRLKYLTKIYAQFPGGVRHVLPDVSTLSLRLQRVLMNANNRRTGKFDSNELVMPQFFAQGRSMISQSYLDYIDDNSSPGTTPPRIRRTGHGSLAPRKRKGNHERPDDHGSHAAKRTKIIANTTPDRLIDNSMNALSTDTGVLGDVLLTSMETPPSPAHQKSNGPPGDEAMRGAFENIDTLIRAFPSQVFGSQEGKRTAQLTTKPGPELQEVYNHALGTSEPESWKLIAIKLQGNSALVAEDFLQCIVWAFLIWNVFESNTVGKELSDITSLVADHPFVVAAIDAAGKDGKSILRDTIARRLDDAVFVERVVDPQANVSTRKLMLLLEQHLPRQLTKVELGRLTRQARAICKASLILRVKRDSMEAHYSFGWYTNGLADRFDEAFMEGLPGQDGGMVAFTLTPGLRRGTDPNQVVLCRARVNTTDA